MTTPGYEEEETVRIFIQFDRVESATKAQVDLQVRVVRVVNGGVG